MNCSVSGRRSLPTVWRETRGPGSRAGTTTPGTVIRPPKFSPVFGAASKPASAACGSTSVRPSTSSFRQRHHHLRRPNRSALPNSSASEMSRPSPYGTGRPMGGTTLPKPLATELCEMAKRALRRKRPRPLPGLVRDPAFGAGALPNLVAGVDNDPLAAWLGNVVLARRNFRRCCPSPPAPGDARSPLFQRRSSPVGTSRPNGGVFAAGAPLRSVGFVNDRRGRLRPSLQEACLATFYPKRARTVTITAINGAVVPIAKRRCQRPSVRDIGSSRVGPRRSRGRADDAAHTLPPAGRPRRPAGLESPSR